MHRLQGILCCLLLTSIAHATTRTVEPGGSIAACAAQSQPGDTCLVSDGMYHEGNIDPPSGVTIQALHPGQAIVQPNDCEAVGWLVSDGRHDVVWDGMVIDGSGTGSCVRVAHRTTGYGVAVTDMNATNTNVNNTFKNGEIRNTRHSGLLIAGRQWHVLNNWIHDLGAPDGDPNAAHSGPVDHGCYCSVSDSEIRGNRFSGIAAYNIQVYASGSAPVHNDVVADNTFEHSGLGVTFSGSGHTITGNTSVQDGGFYEPDAFIIQSSDTTMEGNTIVGRTVSDQSGGTLRMAHNTFCESGCASGATTPTVPARSPAPASVPSPAQVGQLRVLERP